MSSIKNKIDYAVLKTIEVHHDFNPSEMLSQYVTSGYDSTIFTKNGGARNQIQSVSNADFISEMCSFALKAGELYEKVMLENDDDKNFLKEIYPCYLFYLTVKAKKINPYLMLMSNKNILIDVVFAYGKYNFKYIERFNSLLKRYNIFVNDKEVRPTQNTIPVNNLRFCHGSVNKCVEQLKSGEQFKLSHVEYEIDNCTFAVSDVGKYRNNQEDANVIVHRNDNPEYKLIAVADGMGGALYGELASNETLKLLTEWFENLPISILDNPEELSSMLCTEINKINKIIYDLLNGKGGTTLSCAIICNGVTITCSIGDSRIYILNGDELTQISEDDSLVQKLYNHKVILSRDDKRFHPYNNKITKCIGNTESIVIDDISFINNYDLIMIFSDGVTDCVDEKDIRYIALSAPPRDIAREIIEFAKQNDSHKVITTAFEKYDTFIPGGIDNLTAVVYDQKKGR